MDSPAYLHPVMEAEARRMRSENPGSVITSTFRSVAEQQRLYRAWKNGRNPYPVAKPGTSPHHTGLAFDFVAREGARSPQQAALGAEWKGIGGLWWPSDPVHFEHPEAREAVRLGLTSPRWWFF